MPTLSGLPYPHVITGLCLALVLGACGGGDVTLPPDGQPATIAVLEGDEQSGRVGEPLDEPLVVQVTDARRRPVEGATVAFEFNGAGAGASVVPLEKRTNGDGLADARLVLGTTIGRQTGRARVVTQEGRPPVQTSFSAVALSESANSMVAVAGEDQTGHVGQPLDDRLVVEVTDGFGNPVARVPISWVATGGGSVSEAVVETDEDGRSRVERILGPSVGPQTTIASSEGLAGSPVVFGHTAVAGNASRLTVVSGSDQTAEVGTLLPAELVVRLVDSEGNGVPSTGVTWVVAIGGGTVSLQNTITDGEGRTSAQWTLGEILGEQRLDAVVTSVGVVSFRATATAAAPASLFIRTQPSASARNGVRLDRQPVIQLRDSRGNDVAAAGVEVTAGLGGGGELQGTIRRSTDAAGQATFDDLAISGAPGSRTLVFTAIGYAQVISDEIDLQAIGTTTTITGDSPDPSVAGSVVTVNFAVTSSGGTPTGTVTVTVSGSTSPPPCTVTLSNGIGTCQFTLNVVGNRTFTATYSGAPGFAGSQGTEPHVVAPPIPANRAPDADFNWQCEDLTCHFTDRSEDNDGFIASRSWNFGDGSPPSGELNPSHAYAVTGDYTVILTVTDNGGLSDTSTDEVDPKAPPPQVLEINRQPSGSATIGEAFDPQPRIQLRAGGRDVETAGVVISASIASGGGTLGGATTATTNGDGRAEFSNLSISGASGPHTLRFTAAGFAEVISNTIDVGKASSTTTITSDEPDPSIAGSVITVNVQVSSGIGIPTGTVTVSVSGATPPPPCTQTLSNGTASCQFTLNVVGNREFTAEYSGDGLRNESQDQEPHRVDPVPPPPPASTTTTITAVDGVTTPPTASVDGVAITVSFTVNSGSGVPEGNVQVSDGLSGVCTGTVAAGNCSFSPSGAGPRAIVAAYQGSSGFAPSLSGEWAHTVNPSGP